MKYLIFGILMAVSWSCLVADIALWLHSPETTEGVYLCAVGAFMTTVGFIAVCLEKPIRS